MAQLFCYGTLMYQPLLNALIKLELAVEPATLTDFACRGVKKTHYPGIVPCPGGEVKGLLVRNIPRGGWFTLDRYEGEFYRRQEVFVRTDSGVEEQAYAYVIRPRYQLRLSKQLWEYSADAERYAQVQLEKILTQSGQ